MPKRVAIIMAGGGGKRLFPLSKESTPKQNLDLLGTGEPMIAATCRRVRPLVDDIVVVTTAALAGSVRTILPGVTVVAEPAGRNTAAAIMLGMAHLELDATALVLPADHHFEDEAGLCDALQRAVAAAEQLDRIVLVGLDPEIPHPDLGYIAPAGPLETVPNVFAVADKGFKEKPRERAQEYVDAGYKWNLGVFVFKVEKMVDALCRVLKGHYEAYVAIRQAVTDGRAAEVIAERYPGLKDISIDYGVMEPLSGELAVATASGLGWKDLGSWLVLAEARSKGGVRPHEGDVITMDSKDVIGYADDGGTIVLIGVQKLVVTRIGKLTLVAPLDQPSLIGEFVEWAKKNRPELVR